MSARLDRRRIICVYDEIGAATILAGGHLLGVQDGTLMSREDLKYRMMLSEKKAYSGLLIANLKKFFVGG